MKCAGCGAALRESAKICIRCGLAAGAEPSAPARAPGEFGSDSPSPEPASYEVITAAVPTPSVAPQRPHVELPEEERGQVQATPTLSRVEVAAEFARAPKASESDRVPVPSLESKKVLDRESTDPTRGKPGLIWVGIGILVLAVLGGANLLLRGSHRDAPISAGVPNPAAQQPPASTEPERASSSQSTGRTPAQANRQVDKALLNALLSLAANDAWVEFNGVLATSSSIQFDVNDAKLAEQHGQLGKVALAAHRWAEASRHFKSALESNGNLIEARLGLAESLIAQKKFELAQDAIVETLQVSVQLGRAWFYAAEVFAERDDPSSAQNALKVAIYLASDRDKALKSLSDEANISSAKFRSTVTVVLPKARSIPAR